MLRDGFNWGGLPERVAAPVWDSIGTAEHARCHRLAVHWRTARWSLNARGSTSMVALLNTVLSGAVGSVGVGDGCLRVALIAQFKEDPDGQEAAWAQMQATLTKLNGAGSPYAAALIRSDSSKSIFDADATVGNDDAEVFLRDLALMATAHVLFVGRSQFSQLATSLQRADGVHVVSDRRHYVPTLGDAGPCQLLPNTILPEDVARRAQQAARPAGPGRNPIAAFIDAPPSTPVCPYPTTLWTRDVEPEMEAAARRLLEDFGRCEHDPTWKERRSYRKGYTGPSDPEAGAGKRDPREL